jgi:predicted membrane GTPase involved in stress response
VLQVVVVVNKIDRPAARPEWVVDSTFELFMDLGATDEQCDFPVVYASGVNGIAGMAPTDLAADLQPLFETIVREVRGLYGAWFAAVCQWSERRFWREPLLTWLPFCSQ